MYLNDYRKLLFPALYLLYKNKIFLKGCQMYEKAMICCNVKRRGVVQGAQKHIMIQLSV